MIDLDNLPTSPTGKRMLSRVSPIYDDSYFMKSFYQALGEEIFLSLREQTFIERVTWGIEYLEHKYSVEPNPNLSLEERRARLRIRSHARFPLNPAFLKKKAMEFWGLDCYFDETEKAGYIFVSINNYYEPRKFKEMSEYIQKVRPAHLELKYRVSIEDLPDDDEDCDSVADINDYDRLDEIDGKSFFMQTGFPIVENVPYGNSQCDAPKFDGSVQVKPPRMFDGKFIIKYNGANTEAAQVGKSYRWWFVPTGESNFNKEFRFDGAIKFDGLKPQTIEYDDGMDDLSVIEIEKILEDEITEQIQYDGNTKFNGEVKRKIPDDDGGKIEIAKFKRFNGDNVGDINLFDGSIKADGKFNFDSGGNRARIEKISDDLSGIFSNVKPQKEFPISEFYPEIYEYVPRTFEEQSAKISVGTFEENIETPTENYPQSVIRKVIRCNGTKNYNGGDLNLFDGTIKANGKFNFEGGGSRAKIEVIAIDLDGSLSLKHIKKDKPPFVYVENSDFVSQTQDKVKISVQNNFEEIVNLQDCGGDLTISRRRKFDGYFSYRGDFENSANGLRRYSGGLNYNGVYRQEADGFSKFDGAERYGGRKNYSVYEVVTDLDGNFKVIEIIDFEKIPIATYDKLGYVIAGENVDIDVEGKISLAKDFKLPNMTEMESGKLKNIFESWRKGNAV